MTNKEPNRIREIRLTKGMTLQEVADKTGITTDPAQIQKLEKGLRSLTPKWLKVVSKALDVQPYELLPNEWQPNLSLKNLKMISVPVIAGIQEGVWQQGLKFLHSANILIAHEHTQLNTPTVYTNRPDKFNEDQLFAVEVQDDAMQTLYPRGTVLVCVKKKAYDAIENGKRVVCVKTNSQMHASQLFIRRYANTDGQDLLFSDIPGHLDVDMTKPGELEVLGVIIKSIRSE